MPDDGRQFGATPVAADLKKLTPQQIADIQRDNPVLPDDYFNYLRSAGWGETESGRMIFEGPITAAEIYGPHKELGEIVLLGDDFQGSCFGFNFESSRYGEVDDDGRWQEWPIARGIHHYVADGDEAQGM